MHKILNLAKFYNKNGTLTVAEFKSLKFNIKRIFSVLAPKGAIRGQHAHKKCRQILYCLYGKIEITILSEIRKKKIILSKSSKAVLIPKMTWVKLKFLKKNSLCIVICDQYFLEKDYIRSFDLYKKLIKKA